MALPPYFWLVLLVLVALGVGIWWARTQQLDAQRRSMRAFYTFERTDFRGAVAGGNRGEAGGNAAFDFAGEHGPLVLVGPAHGIARIGSYGGGSGSGGVFA